jgi:ketosteroid isomerase-like protein
MREKLLFSALAALILTIFASLTTLGQKQDLTPAEQEVRKLERLWLDAYEKRDVAAMTAIVADDFMITFPDGGTETKPEILESLKRLVVSATKFKTEEVKSRLYGDVVILTGIVITEWMQNGNPMTDRSRYTDTYVKRNGKWQVVASHMSRASK